MNHKLHHAVKSYATYGRFINDLTWNCYFKVIEHLDADAGRLFLKAVMENNFDDNRKLILLFTDHVVNYDESYRNVDDAITEFIEAVNDKP